jgi:hypothetical protein
LIKEPGGVLLDVRTQNEFKNWLTSRFEMKKALNSIL